MTVSHSTRPPLHRPSVRPSERGYMLLTAIFFLVLMVLALTLATPKVIKSIQRDHDLETYHRGMQYRRAIQLYYRKFHAYPPTVDALVNTNEIKFLRKKYIDPTTGKDDWKPVLFGQNKAPTAMGFFGQPLSGTTIAGIGPSGTPGMGSNGNPSSFGGMPTSNFGATGGAGGSIYSSSGTDSSGNSSAGSSGTTGSTDNSSGTNSSGSSSGNPGSGGSGSGSSTSSSSFGSGQTFGGAGIIGFSPAGSKQAILVYKKKTHYNEWEFTYDPISDMQTMGGGNAGMLGQQGANGLNGQQGINGVNGQPPPGSNTGGFSITPPSTPPGNSGPQ